MHEVRSNLDDELATLLSDPIVHLDNVLASNTCDIGSAARPFPSVETSERPFAYNSIRNNDHRTEKIVGKPLPNTNTGDLQNSVADLQCMFGLIRIRI